MENSPLELYETAYRLHYVDGRLAEALNFYEALIKDFPDSHECGYAAIQIQKIKSNDLAKALRKRGGGLQPIPVIALILVIVSLVGSAAAGYFFYGKLQTDSIKASLSLQAFAKMARGEDDEALKLLAELKLIDKKDITPFELSADIYRKKRLFDQSRSEYELFYRLNPGRQPTAGELSIMRLDEDKMKKAESKSLELVTDSVPIAPQPVSRLPAMPPLESFRSRAKLPVKQRARIPAAQKPIRQSDKSPHLVDPDSISYF